VKRLNGKRARAVTWEAQTTFGAVVPANPESVSLVRRFLSHCLLLVDSAASEADAVLVLSELVNNAVQYGGAPTVQVRVRFDEDLVHLEVRDAGRGTPPTDSPEPGATGHGLQIVASLSEDWGWSRDGTGTVVWARLSSAAA
jgi:anti-sigma regulatory factor (Ser/Thr protein kinase)